MRILKPGNRFKSAVCETQIMVVRGGTGEIDLRCGGVPVIAMDAAPPGGAAPDPAFAQGSLTGKRYIDAAEQIELLCTKGGDGSLSIGSVALGIKQAKALPSSDGPGDDRS